MLKKIAVCAMLASVTFIFGCSNESSSANASAVQATRSAAQLDEEGLVAAVGSPSLDKYNLDDGYGFAFRADGNPAFKLEFRQNRVNVAWEAFPTSDGSFDSVNAENAHWGQQVLNYAIGDALAKDVFAAINTQQSTKFNAYGHEVRVMPGSMQNLVTLYSNK